MKLSGIWKTPDVVFAPQQICAYYVRLFRKPEFLLERFSKSQLDQGFWAIFGGPDWALQHLLWETENPLPGASRMRESDVRSFQPFLCNRAAGRCLHDVVGRNLLRLAMRSEGSTARRRGLGNAGRHVRNNIRDPFPRFTTLSESCASRVGPFAPPRDSRTRSALPRSSSFASRSRAGIRASRREV